MYVTYLADFDKTWQHEKYLGANEDAGKALVQMENWIEKRTTAALRDRRRVWVYWPYWDDRHADDIIEAISKIQARLVKNFCTDATGLGKRVKTLVRHFEVPILPGFQKISNAHCVVYYVEPSKQL
jgi:hypothetical protein